MKSKSNNKGSVLLLTMMVSFLLSLIIAAGLTQKQTSMVSNNAFKQSNRALYLAMRGLHNGMELMRVNYNQPNIVEFNQADFVNNDLRLNEYYRSAPLWHDPDDSNPNYTVKPFPRYYPPPLPGMSLDATKKQPILPFKLFVSSALKTGEIDGQNVYTRRGVEVVIYFLSPMSGLD